MRTSTNYGFKLPEGTDNVKRQDFVDNFEKIDRELKNNDTQVKEIANDSYPIVEATGTNAYVGSTARITKLSKGTRCTLFVSTSSTGNCSLNLNSYGAKNIKDSFGNVVTNLKSNIPYNLCYNGLDFILQGKGGGGNATADKLLSGSTATVDSGPIAGTMTNQGSKTASLNCGGSYIIPTGYHNGSGKVTANSLASQTSATATAVDIGVGKTAWVNGSQIIGSASIVNNGYGKVLIPKKTYPNITVDVGSKINSYVYIVFLEDYNGNVDGNALLNKIKSTLARGYLPGVLMIKYGNDLLCMGGNPDINSSVYTNTKISLTDTGFTINGNTYSSISDRYMCYLYS